MIIAVIAVRMMKPTFYEVIDVIAMRHLFVAACIAMMMLLFVSFDRLTDRRICRGYIDYVLIHMVAVHVMEMPIMQIIHMPSMLDRRMSAIGTMLMSVIAVCIAFFHDRTLRNRTAGFMGTSQAPEF